MCAKFCLWQTWVFFRSYLIWHIINWWLSLSLSLSLYSSFYHKTKSTSSLIFRWAAICILPNHCYQKTVRCHLLFTVFTIFTAAILASQQYLVYVIFVPFNWQKVTLVFFERARARAPKISHTSLSFQTNVLSIDIVWRRNSSSNGRSFISCCCGCCCLHAQNWMQWTTPTTIITT